MNAPHPVIALERKALDRWGKGDPGGFLEIYDDGISYFDPSTEQRIDGRERMQAYYAPIARKIIVDKYEMINPLVQDFGDVAVLTYNLRSHAKGPGGRWVWVRWNSTVVYRRSGVTWKSVHSHWSYVKPEFKHARPVG